MYSKCSNVFFVNLITFGTISFLLLHCISQNWRSSPRLTWMVRNCYTSEFDWDVHSKVIIIDLAAHVHGLLSKVKSALNGVCAFGSCNRANCLLNLLHMSIGGHPGNGKGGIKKRRS